MVILILERAAVGMRGEVTRWMIEPRPGLFVGKMSAMVRDKLWARVCDKHNDAAVMVYPSQTEQGFSVRVSRDPTRKLIEREGLYLVTVPVKKKVEKPTAKPEKEVKLKEIAKTDEDQEDIW